MSARPSSFPRAAALVAIVALAAVLRFWALDFGLPHLMTRPDEEVILVATRSPASGKFDLEYGIYPSLYVLLTWVWGEGGHRVLQGLGLNPPGDYLSAMATAPWQLLLVDRALSAFEGVAAVALLAWVTSRELGACAGLIAGALLATNFLHVRDSHAAKPDILLSLGVTAALGVMAPLFAIASTRRAIATGVVIGLSMGMKYPAVMLLVPVYVACVASSPARDWRRLIPRTAVLAGLAAGLTFVVSSPDLLMNPETRRRVLWIVPLVFPQWFPQLENTGGVPPGIVDIQHPTSAWEGYAYYATFALRYGCGLAFVLLLPIATVWGLLSRRGLAVSAAVFGIVGFAAFGASPALLSRYMTPLLPAFAILVAGVIMQAARRLGTRPWLAPALAVAVIVVVAEPLWSSIQHDRIAAATDTRVLATNWLREHARPGDTVALAGTVFWSWGEPNVPQDLTMVRTKLDPAEIDAAGARYLVTHDHTLFSSRVDAAALARLKPRLALVAEMDPFVGPREAALFDAQDAYYIPMHGFGAVSRPGPVVRIYEIQR